jgi:hypothetical protein
MSEPVRVIPQWRTQFEARRLARAVLALLSQLEEREKPRDGDAPNPTPNPRKDAA